MLKDIVEKQRKYFLKRETYDVGFRVLQLKRLRLQIDAYYNQILSAFEQDLNKKEFDVVTTEVGLVMSEINYMIKHLKKLAKPKKVSTSIVNFPSKGYKIYDPYGVESGFTSNLTLDLVKHNYPGKIYTKAIPLKFINKGNILEQEILLNVDVETVVNDIIKINHGS